MRELLYVAPRARLDRDRRAPRARARQPDLPGARRRRWSAARPRPGTRRSSATPPAPPQREAEYVHMLVERRVDGMIFISSEVTDLRSDHRSLRPPARGGGAARLRERLRRLARGHLRRSRRARGREARDRAPARARAPAHRLRRRRATRAADARQGGGPCAGAASPPGIDADGLVAHASFSVEGGRRALRAAPRVARRARRPASSARAT